MLSSLRLKVILHLIKWILAKLACKRYRLRIVKSLLIQVRFGMHLQTHEVIFKRFGILSYAVRFRILFSTVMFLMIFFVVQFVVDQKLQVGQGTSN